MRRIAGQADTTCPDALRGRTNADAKNQRGGLAGDMTEVDATEETDVMLSLRATAHTNRATVPFA